jgi:hypothetical protein
LASGTSKPVKAITSARSGKQKGTETEIPVPLSA